MTTNLCRAVVAAALFLALGSPAQAQLNKWLGIPSGSGGTSFSPKQGSSSGRKPKKPVGGQPLGRTRRLQEGGVDMANVGGRPPRPPGTPQTPKPSGPTAGGIIRDVGRIIGALERVDQNSRQTYDPNQRRYQDNVSSSYRQPARRPAYPPAEKPVVVTENPKPPEKINEARDNEQPGGGLETMDAAELSLANQVVKQKAEESIDELESSLAGAANNKEIQDLLKEARDKVENGEPLDADWQDRLQAALQDHVDAGGDLPGYDNEKMISQLDDLYGLTDANSILSADPNPNGGMPSGATNIVSMPYWPEDEMCMCPDGSVMVGTGGVGGIKVVQADAEEVLGLPIGAGEPEPDQEGDVASRVKSGILLMNPAANGATINYVIGDNNYSMQTGYTQRLDEGRTWVIRFDRGDGKGEARYTLSDGTYAFTPTDKGWDLYRSSFSVTIDNSRNDGTFYYNADNVQEEIGPGQQKSHTSIYPIYVRFDRGNGGAESQKKFAAKEHRLQVAVNPKDGFWELFPSDVMPKFSGNQAFSSASPVAAPPVTKSADDRKAERAARLRALLLAKS